MKTLLCCIIKMENLYLRDFIEYYKRIGFDNVVLYDNNDINGEYPQQVIGDYISGGFVIYKDCRGKHRYQLSVYEQCYEEYKNTYDWIAFFDADEFLVIKECDKINDFLSQEKFQNAHSVLVYWVDYGDNDMLHYDSRPVYERFLEPSKKSGEINVFKLILRCFPNGFADFSDVNSCTLTEESISDYLSLKADGQIVSLRPFKDYCYNCAVLNHYHTLTIEEFLYRRFVRGSVADTATPFSKERVMRVFYDVNDMTDEKQQIVDGFFEKFSIFEDAPSKQPHAPHIKRRLVFYFYAFNEFEKNYAVQLHLKCLKYFSFIFDEATFIISVDDVNDENLIFDVEENILKCGFKNLNFKIHQNNGYCESDTFCEEIVSKLKILDGLTFFAHTKGITNVLSANKRNDYMSSIEAWILGMYFLNLQFLDEVESSLTKGVYRFYGSFLTNLTNEWAKCWMYPGTFFWINCPAVYRDICLMRAEDILPAVCEDRGTAEYFPGKMYLVEGKNKLYSHNNKTLENYSCYFESHRIINTLLGDDIKEYEAFYEKVTGKILKKE